MKERSFDEMIAYFNRRVSEMDIARDYKIELLGMITALGYKHEKSVPQWIPCSERLPYVEYGESDTVLTTCGYRDVEDTSVRWIRLLYFNGGNWCYPTGETYEAKVYAWMPLPEPWRGESNDNT